MKRIAHAIIMTDGAILIHVFVRPVWYVDCRWHKNQYDQAAIVMSFALALDVAGTTSMLLHGHDIFAWLVLSPLTALLVFMYGLWVKQLGRASRDYERAPDRLHRSQTLFQWIAFPPLRLLMAIMGLLLTLLELPVAIEAHTAYHWLHYASTFWMPLIGCSLYIAGVPHSPLGRKKKKEREPLAAPLLSPTT